jgi:acyloxyacyl hydrolase
VGGAVSQAQGGDPKDLIEAADGFHPSQLGNAIGTKFFFERLERELPTWIGPVNPYNSEIDRLFGELGGH